MELWNTFAQIADGYKLLTLLVLILVVLVLGVVNALRKKDGGGRKFVLSAIADIARTRLVPYVLGYYVLCIAAAVDGSLHAAATAGWGVVVAALVGNVLAGLKQLGFHGLPEILAGDKK